MPIKPTYILPILPSEIIHFALCKIVDDGAISPVQFDYNGPLL